MSPADPREGALTGRRGRRRRALLGLTGALVVAAALTAIAHTSLGRGSLRYLGDAGVGAGVCPMGLDHAASPESIEARRRRSAKAMAGSLPSRARPALGFDLGRTTRVEVLTWAAREGVLCREPRERLALSCTDVPRAALALGADGAAPGVGTLMLGFDTAGVLVSLGTVRRTQDLSAALLLQRRLTTVLTETAGPPTESAGEASEDFFSREGVRQSRVDFRFTDYSTRITVSRVLTNDYVIAENYLLIDT